LGTTVWAWRRQPALGFLGAWFFLILAPTSSFVPIADVCVEHRMYLPLAAVVTGMVLGAVVLGMRLLGQRQGRALAGVASGTVSLVLAVLTIHRNEDYRSELTIWRDTANKCPGNPRAHNNLGNALVQAGDLREAMRQWEWALRIEPGYAEAHNNLGNALVESGRAQESIAHYEAALRIKPDYAEAHNNLGNALARTGQPQEAIPQFERAVQLKPDYVQALINLAWQLAVLPPGQGGNPTRAVALAQHACELTDHRVAVYLDTEAMAYGAAGRFGDAIAAAQRALQLARSAGQVQLAGQIETRLQSYRASQGNQITH
jgi:protein O-mannosyl-transferase